jgi:hypothetical protein
MIIALVSIALPASALAEAGDAARYRLSGSAQMLKSTGGTYRLDVFTIDGGGGGSVSADSRYRLRGTIGQADAEAPATAPRYRLQGGFWPDAGAGGAVLFKNSFENP